MLLLAPARILCSSMMTASPPSPLTALWSRGLSDDLLASIFRRLPPPDLTRCSAVCHSWHSLISRTHRPSHLPWLLLSTQTPTNDDKAICNFYSLSHQQNFSINVPLGGRRRWDHVVNPCGDSLIVADDNSNLHLVKPLSGAGAGAACLSLPPTATLPRVQAIHGGDDEECITGYHYSYPVVNGYESSECDTYYFGKAVVLWASPSTYTIFVIDRMSDIGLVRARERDREWKVWLSSGYGGRIIDVIYHDGMGRLLALDNSGTVQYCDESIQNIGMFISPRRYFFRNATISDGLKFRSCGCKLVGLVCRCRRYLVQISGDVLQVQRLGVDCGFKVYKLEKRSWVETKDLGDYSLFLDSTNCFSLSARFCPEVRANCIYFAHSHDPGIFQLEDGSISSFHLKGHHSTKFIWFLPKLCAGNLEMKEEEDVNKQEAKASDPIHRREEKKRKEAEHARKEAMANISQGLYALFPSSPGFSSRKETRTAATYYPRMVTRGLEIKLEEEPQVMEGAKTKT